MKNKQIIGFLISIVLLTELCADGQSSVAVTTLINCQTQILTLTANWSSGGSVIASYNTSTNQIITLNNVGNNSGSGTPNVVFTYSNGRVTGYTGTGAGLPITYTGLTNISLSNGGYPVQLSATFTILTPSTNSMPYIPVNSVVIPSDATGNVQIILESSSDMVNWIPSQAGTYGSTYSNRFFRVRALAQ